MSSAGISISPNYSLRFKSIKLKKYFFDLFIENYIFIGAANYKFDSN